MIFSTALYFVMVVLQFNVVCLVMILWALVLAVFPMLASFSIYARNYVELIGRGGIWGICISYNAFMSGLLWR